MQCCLIYFLNEFQQDPREYQVFFLSCLSAQQMPRKAEVSIPVQELFLTLVIILATVSIELLPPFRATDTKVCGLQQGFRGVLGPKREVEVPLPLCLYCADTFLL